MKQKSKRRLTPKLRFPEFRDSGNWNAQKLGSVTTIIKGKGVSKAEYVPDGKQPCIRYGELYTHYGEVIEKVVAHTNANADDLVLSRKQDVIIPSSGETKTDIATASCVMLDNVALGSDLNILRSHLYGPFFSYYLNGSKRFDIAKFAQGDTVAHLYPSQLEKVEITYPPPPEQQKIADCLSSLDRLIVAEGRKLAALRDHKRGLMQQLFPQPGHTQPRLRFPEFRGKGEWVERRLGDFISERSEMASVDVPLFSLTIDAGVTAKTKRYERSFLVTDESEAYKIVQPNDFAFNPMNLRFGAIARHSGLHPVALSKYYNIFSCDKSVDAHFCHVYFRSDVMVALYDRIATGSLIEKRRVHFDQFLKLDIRFPKIAEQKHIADCLSALDTLITAQAAKIETLKQHKRGLMQQLFPAPEEV